MINLHDALSYATIDAGALACAMLGTERPADGNPDADPTRQLVAEYALLSIDGADRMTLESCADLARQSVQRAGRA